MSSSSSSSTTTTTTARTPWELWASSLVSASLVPAAYGLLALVAHAWLTKSLLSALFLVAVLWAVYGLCFYRKSLHAQKTSAPSFVAAHIALAFMTCVYMLLPVIDAWLSTAFIFQSLLLAFLFWRMMISDPGRANCISHKHFKIEDGRHKIQTSHIQDLPRIECLEKDDSRGKYCSQCNSFIIRFDHHCAAVKNCIGCKNHWLFLILLAAFALTEMLYLWCCIAYLRATEHQFLFNQDAPSFGDEGFWIIIWEVFCHHAWVLSIALFASMQFLWQVPFLIFHLYCVAVNLTTDEWVNWEKYSTFFIELPPELGHPFPRKQFVNPYDHGLTRNICHFCTSYKRNDVL